MTFHNVIIPIKSVINKYKNLYYVNLHYWFFLSYNFKFQPYVCNRCHELLMMSMTLSDIAVLNIKDSNYWCIISLISKNEAINLMQNADLAKKEEHYKP